MLFELWDNFGWWLVVLGGVIWLVSRIGKRKEPHSKAPTWGLVASCSFISLLLGALVAVQSSTEVPNVIIGVGSPPNPCAAEVNMSRLLGFQKEFSTALVCIVGDPTVEVLTDKRLAVSNLFEITPGTALIEAKDAMTALTLKDDQERRLMRTGSIQLRYFIILVPRDPDFPKEKITTLGDLMRQGGKIIDKRYYK